MVLTDTPEQRICFVNCGLPGDQCACFRAQMAAIYAGLLTRQVPPDPDLDRIWSENVEVLYQD